MKKCILLHLLILLFIPYVPAQSVRTTNQIAILQQQIKPLYRKPTRDELAAIAPKPELFKKYASFLSRTDTGLTRLAADAGCAESAHVVVATEDCLKYSMPGAGFAYSFRIDNYRLPSLADLIYTENSFQASGVLLHGIFVNIGDVPLEKVTLKTEGMKFLVDFKPATSYQDAKSADQKLTDGIIQDGFVYRRGLKAMTDSTFILRSIAYNGTHYKAVKGVTYNELSFDKRKDIIVAFRVVAQDEDQSVTILWKKLSRKNAPKIDGGRKVKRL